MASSKNSGCNHRTAADLQGIDLSLSDGRRGRHGQSRCARTPEGGGSTRAGRDHFHQGHISSHLRCNDPSRGVLVRLITRASFEWLGHCWGSAFDWVERHAGEGSARGRLNLLMMGRDEPDRDSP